MIFFFKLKSAEKNSAEKSYVKVQLTVKTVEIITKNVAFHVRKCHESSIKSHVSHSGHTG